MSQLSITQYFGARKRSAIDPKLERARKVLILSQEGAEKVVKDINPFDNEVDGSQLILQKPENEVTAVEVKRQFVRKEVLVPRSKKHKSNSDIQDVLNNMKKRERCVTPTIQPEKNSTNELNDIKKKLSRSTKLGELKASINKLKNYAQDLKAAEKKTDSLSQSPKLGTFKSIEIEVCVSPQKLQSPEKPYLSPKKESTVRRNLLNSLSPVKDSCVKQSWNNTVDSIKPCLQLPFKYKTLSEMFRATDTVAQILYNREELITFKKLKPAIEQMVKRTFLHHHLAQFRFVYPAAYEYTAQKIPLYGTRIREQWDLVLTPNIKNGEGLSSKILLDRRRKFNELLIDIVKDYHNEFLLSLTPPMVISKDNITRWHPEFDIEKVPEIQLADLPQIPVEDSYSSGKEVLEKARQMFKCNTRMEQALSKLKEIENDTHIKKEETVPQVSLLKGIPKALLEKVRQKQAAKALLSMTRTAEKEKELQMYARLPELARLLRSIFVSEKKSVIELDIVINKLANSYRCFLNDVEIKDHIKVISREIPDWLVFHNLRNSVFLKLSKNADLSVVVNKLEKLAKEKSES